MKQVDGDRGRIGTRFGVRGLEQVDRRRFHTLHSWRANAGARRAAPSKTRERRDRAPASLGPRFIPYVARLQASSERRRGRSGAPNEVRGTNA
jgi:hypothetical protein